MSDIYDEPIRPNDSEGTKWAKLWRIMYNMGSVLPTGAATEATLSAVNSKLAGTLDVSGPLTDAQLRASEVPVSVSNFPATQNVSGPLTNTQLREKPVSVGIADGANLDSFSRLRVSIPKILHEGQFTYNLLPLRYQAVVTAGGTITHQAQDRCALMNFTSVTNGEAYMQTYDYFVYRPFTSQIVACTFNMFGGVVNVKKFAGLADKDNGFYFELDGLTPTFKIVSTTRNGNSTVPQTDWNKDKLDGTGPSGITLDLTKEQIFVMDFQALYAGRVRFGFDIGGILIYAHEINHANISVYPYIAYATLPLKCGMVSVNSAPVTTSMLFFCSAVLSEGGDSEEQGLPHSGQTSLTAASGVDTHAISIRPTTTFYGFRNNSKLDLYNLDILVTGNTPVQWKLCIGQALSGTPAWATVSNTSAFELDTAGVANGAPFQVVESGFVSASSQQKGSIDRPILQRIPITLDKDGLQRLNGTLTLLVRGIGGSSACQVSINWREVR